MKVVVDTNALVSGLINAQGGPGRIVDLLRVDVLQVVVDDRILAEYRDVWLARPSAGTSPGTRRSWRWPCPRGCLW